jgi:hypothetical protein
MDGGSTTFFYIGNTNLGDYHMSILNLVLELRRMAVNGIPLLLMERHRMSTNPIYLSGGGNVYELSDV